MVTETPSPQISITNLEWCVLFFLCTCCISNPPGIKIEFPNWSIIILIVYNLQEGASCQGAFKPSFIYKWLPPNLFQTHENNYTMYRCQNLACVDFNKPWALGSQNNMFITTHNMSFYIDQYIVLMIHESGNLICILSYSWDYLPPVSRLVWVVFTSHLNIPRRSTLKGEIQVIQYAKLHLTI